MFILPQKKKKQQAANTEFYLTNDTYTEVFPVQTHWGLQFILKHSWIDRWIEEMTDEMDRYVI